MRLRSGAGTSNNLGECAVTQRRCGEQKRQRLPAWRRLRLQIEPRPPVPARLWEGPRSPTGREEAQSRSIQLRSRRRNRSCSVNVVNGSVVSGFSSILPPGGYGWELAAFVIGVFLQLLGLPFVAVSQVSLFSKVTSEKTQGDAAHVGERRPKERPLIPCDVLTHRLQPGRPALRGGPRHHPGPAVGWRIDQ